MLNNLEKELLKILSNLRQIDTLLIRQFVLYQLKVSLCLIKKRLKVTTLLNIKFNYNRFTKLYIQIIIYTKKLINY